MICKPCAEAADTTTDRLSGKEVAHGTNRNVHHRCDYPVSCTCQHRKRKA